jgi:hypothetical protein
MPDRTKVTIFEIAERPWGWLTTSAEVDITPLRVPFLKTAVRWRGARVFDRRPATSRQAVAVCTGPDFRKRKKSRNRISRISPSRLDSQNLFTISKLCMIFLALIPVMNYYA